MFSLVTGRGLPWNWSDPSNLPQPAERHEPRAAPGARRAVRAVTTSADSDALFLWLCQLRRAPYSYDWIDNFGRRSPQNPDPEMTLLEVGQPVMTIFTLVDFAHRRSITLQMQSGWPERVFGSLTVRYDIVTVSALHSVLRATLWMPTSGRLLSRARRYALAWADLPMMSKQLRTLTGYAESGTGCSPPPGSAAPGRP